MDEELILEQVKPRAVRLADTVRNFQIVDYETCEQLAGMVTASAAYRKTVTEHYRPLKQAIQTSLDKVRDQEKSDLAVVDQVRTLALPKIDEWRDKEASRLRREAAERAEQERLRLEAERQERVDKAKAEGDKAKARDLALTPVEVPKEVVVRPQVPGITSRMTWDFEITEADKIPRKFLMPNEKLIRSYVQAMKEASDLPGVRVFQVRGSSVRASG